MAGRYTFHNKFHRSNHHSISGAGIIDAGLDPIASSRYPFQGIFYNLLTDSERTFNILTNSYDWWSAYTTVLNTSATWMLTRSLYTTVSSLSDRWNDGFSAYTSFNSLSDRIISLYTTVCSYSADWGSPYLVFTNRVQQYTHAKTFSGQNLRPIGSLLFELSTFNWDLNTQQVAFLNLVNTNVFVRNPLPTSMVNGGMYTLVVNQPRDTSNVYNVSFDTKYRFNDRDRRDNAIFLASSAITVINFICAEGLMFGDVVQLSGNAI